MSSFNILVLVAVGYVLILFGVAFFADRKARRGQLGWLRSPLVYTLSLSIYCTAWTFYGAVGSAARNGLEFIAIYLGPTLVFVGWWWFLRKLVRIGRTHRITSIADLLSSRYGKSAVLAVIVTVLAVVGSTPYIALQLQSVALSFSVLAASGQPTDAMPDVNATAFWLAVGLAIFTIFFGTRNLDANERHHGVVTAIAIEAVVKLLALIAVGVFVVWGVAGGPSDILEQIEASEIVRGSAIGSRWVSLLFLSAAAIICLPRMFQVTVVENADESHLSTASWAFPLYLFLMSLFVLPIAVVGLNVLPEGANPDLFVLTLPISQDQDALAMLAFLGGFSSATSMVIVAAIALSTMVSNHIVMPFWLALTSQKGPVQSDVRLVLIRSRRISIAAVLALGYGYFRFTGGSSALASIGLIAFTGVAQVLPAMIGGIFWRGATRRGAIAGLCAGFAIWAYTLLLPSFEGSFIMSAEMLAHGPFGIAALTPQALFGATAADPLVHALTWSLSINTAIFIVLSLVSFPDPVERLQGMQFVSVFAHSTGQASWVPESFAIEDLLAMTKRTMGQAPAVALFDAAATNQGRQGDLPEATSEFVEYLERELAGTVGAATANAMVGQIAGGSAISVDDLIAMADETAQIMEHSTQLEVKSQELAQTARQLQEANEKLTELSIQKDGFLSQVSHELRTPMTSIRSFAEILRETESLSREEQQRFSQIILDESIRLTKLLDEILDLSFLENAKVLFNLEEATISDVLNKAVLATSDMKSTGRLNVTIDENCANIAIATDLDRLSQVFINLITNAGKYCDAEKAELTVSAFEMDDVIAIEFADNGAGIPKKYQKNIFEKFFRVSETTASGEAGLGLPISREIMRNLGGTLDYLPERDGTVFYVRLPVNQSLGSSS